MRGGWFVTNSGRPQRFALHPHFPNQPRSIHFPLSSACRWICLSGEKRVSECQICGKKKGSKTTKHIWMKCHKKHESFSHHCFPVGSLLQWPPNGRWFKSWCKRLSTTYPLSILSVSLSLSLSMSLSLALSLSLYCIVDDLPGVNIGFWRQIRRRCSPRSARSASHLFLFFSTDLRCSIRFPSFSRFFQRISHLIPIYSLQSPSPLDRWLNLNKKEMNIYFSWSGWKDLNYGCTFGWELAMLDQWQ